jgi:hypothetical protein
MSLDAAARGLDRIRCEIRALLGVLLHDPTINVDPFDCSCWDNLQKVSIGN